MTHRVDWLSSTPFTLRHVKPGDNTTVLSVGFDGEPIDPPWTGQYERRLNEEGTATLNFPNATGADGVAHRDRFLVIAQGHATPTTAGAQFYTGGTYRPGDEWIEIREGRQLRFVGTPIRAEVTDGQVTLSLVDAVWLQRKTRGTSADIWTAAPADVFEHYTGTWRAAVADDFATGETFAYATTTTETLKWSYVRVESDYAARPSRVRLRTGVVAGEAASISGKPFPLGYNYLTTPTEGVAHARFEGRIHLAGVTSNAGDYFQFGFATANLASYAFLRATQTALSFQIAGVAGARKLQAKIEANRDHHFAIEARGRWIFFYFDAAMVGYVQAPASWEDAIPHAAVNNGSTTAVTGDIDHLLLRTHEPFLARGAVGAGDRHLPGAPTAGGLLGSYFNERPTQMHWAAADLHNGVLGPAAEPYARRVDSTIAFSAVAPPLWQAPGPPNGEHFAVRWTGSVYLDLDQYDYALRVTGLDGRVRVWIGDTRFNRTIIGAWTGTDQTGTHTANWLKAGSVPTAAPDGETGHLARQGTGWYPVIIEYSNFAGAAGITVEYQRSDDLGVWTAVPSSMLSPLGVFVDQTRFESHYDRLKALAQTFGLQFTCEPKALESGEFPGRVVARVKEGRDTDFVLDSFEGTDIQDSINAEDVCDALLADAQGLADPQSQTQVVAERFSFPQVDRHLFVHQEYEQSADITIPELLHQRLDSLLALRGSPWEEIGVRPSGRPQFTDTFPLTGDMAEFDWRPGDGLRLNLPLLGVGDQTPRQLLRIEWPIRPEGHGQPQVALRQRPRNMREVLRGMMRGQLLQKRNYQGQVVALTGSLGSTLTSVAPDALSRVYLPIGAQRVISGHLLVQRKVDTSAKTLSINGVSTGLTITVPGDYDVTPWVSAVALDTERRVTAQLTGGTGAHDLQLMLLVRI